MITVNVFMQSDVRIMKGMNEVDAGGTYAYIGVIHSGGYFVIHVVNRGENHRGKDVEVVGEYRKITMHTAKKECNGKYCYIVKLVTSDAEYNVIFKDAAKAKEFAQTLWDYGYVLYAEQ